MGEYVAHYLVLFAEHREAISRGWGSVLFPVACLHYPRTALKTGRIEEADLQRCIEEESSRKAGAWPDSRNDPCSQRSEAPNGPSFAVRSAHRHGCKMLQAIHSLRAPAEIRSSPSLRERGRSALVKIPNDSRRPEGSSLWNERRCATIPVPGNRSRRRTIPAIISACQVTIPFLSILDVLGTLRSKLRLTLTLSSYLLLNCQIFFYNHKKNLFR